MKVNSGDQWLLDGDCTLCRKKSYCGTPCTKQNKYKDNLLKEMTFKAFMKLMMESK